MRKLISTSTIIAVVFLILIGCNKEDELPLKILDPAETELNLDPLDKGGRWLVSAMEETIELNISDDQKATLTNHFNDLALDFTLRCDDGSNDEFVTSIDSYAQEAISLVEDTHIRLCSDLNLHEGYWLYETIDLNSGATIQNIMDLQVDAATMRMTVYAQLKVNGTPFQPAQVGPGSTTSTLTGETAGHHPNAVFLNGSGEEYLEEVGSGSWWVKHSWIVDGEGYQNWPLDQFAIDYGPGTYAEGILMEDGLSIKIGDLDGSESGQYNIRQPITDTNPVSFHILSYPNSQSTEPVVLGVYTITENPSPFDGLARFSPSPIGNEAVAEPFNLLADDDEGPVTFELIEFVSEEEVNVWLVDESITVAEFEAIQLPSNWFRQEASEEGDVNSSRFLRSPDASEDGVFTTKEHFGYQWIFNAQIIGDSIPLPDNEEDLLTARYIAKYQEVTYFAGRTISVLISPDGEEYVRISRDVDRTTEEQIIPDSWLIEERQINEELVIRLPNPTLNIIVNNIGDSFQGPVEL